MKFKSNQDAEKRKALLSQAVRLRMELESTHNSVAYQSSLITILSDLERELSSWFPDRKKLEKAAFGIFRLVTDSFELEKSQLGKDLLSLRDQIHSLISG